MSSTPLKSYSGTQASQISFPLGGIGSGSIGFGGDGRLIDWEIYNRPSKNSRNGNSHFAVRAVSKGKLLDARVLCAELAPPYQGTGSGFHSGFGFGPSGATMAGFPNFRNASFSGEFPFATLDLADPGFPGKVKLTAFNPFIPGDDQNSSLPVAFFEVEFANTTAETIEYSAAFTVANPGEKSANQMRSAKGLTWIQLKDEAHSPDNPRYGDLTLATDAPNAHGQAYWYRGGWCDSLEVFWHEFASANTLPSRRYADAGKCDHATVMAGLRIRPQSRDTVRFALAWNYPNCVNYWMTVPEGEPPFAGWKNYYATQFVDSTKSAAYALKHWSKLRSESDLFRTALHSSTLPTPVLEAVSANLSILKSPTVLRLEDGSFYGWEGCQPSAGCCEGTCSHVWNYAYALPFLFPKLERSIRELNWKYNLREDGGLIFRLKLPLGSTYWQFRPCCDGQFGDIIKFYRDWKISGDTKWMKKLWPSVKKSLEFAWAPSNEDRWDPDKTGVLQGRQHHTLDVELFGPNSWLTGFYHAALKAGAELAEAVGEPESAKEYRDILERGQKWVAQNLFNGKWFIQQLDLSNEAIIQSFPDSVAGYWNSEYREIKYQIGDGIAIDQVLAQWHANLCGLGDIFDPSQCKKALKSIYRHNFKRKMRGVANPWRLYSLHDEAGVLICTWPEGTAKPVIPLCYNSETMYGFEYSAAALMMQEGLLKEGLEIITETRRRFTGDRRNPWNEFECGSNYARSMASYSLLLTLSGFEFDATCGRIGFSPKIHPEAFRSFWSLDSGWGTVEFTKGRVQLTVLRGKLAIAEFCSDEFASVKRVKVKGRALRFVQDGRTVRLAQPITLTAGQVLEIA